MAEYTKFQQKAIKNYYDNREGIAIQRLQELCTELYLAEGKKLEQHWKSMVTHMEVLKVPKKQIDHLLQQKNPELVAKYVQTLLSKAS